MATATVTSASAGTVVAAGAGSIKGLTLTALPTGSDRTPLILTDGPNGLPLFDIDLPALACLVEPRPGMPLTPNLTAPTWPKSLGNWTNNQPYANSVYCKSCPAGTSFTLTT